MKLAPILIASILLILSPAKAQVSATEAKGVLQKASQQMKSYESIKLSFSYVFQNNRVEPPVVQRQDGDLVVKGDNYRLDLPGIRQMRSGNKMYNILLDDEEVQVTDYVDEEDQGITPSKILNLFDHGYSYKMGGSEKVGSKTIQYVILKPNASEDIDKIMIGIDKTTNHLHSMKQWGHNGTTTTLTVTSFSANPSISNNYLTFSESDYPGFYIAD